MILNNISLSKIIQYFLSILSLIIHTSNLFSEEPSTTQNRKVYVAHLPQDYDESKLREIFQSYGEIEDVFVMRDSSGKCKGSGFVKFKEIESATKAIEKLHDKFVVEVCF